MAPHVGRGLGLGLSPPVGLSWARCPGSPATALAPVLRAHPFASLTLLLRDSSGSEMGSGESSLGFAVRMAPRSPQRVWGIQVEKIPLPRPRWHRGCQNQGEWKIWGRAGPQILYEHLRLLPLITGDQTLGGKVPCRDTAVPHGIKPKEMPFPQLEC